MQKSNKNTKLQLDEVCRTCLTSRGHLRDIFSSRIPVYLQRCIRVKIAKDDGLPGNICISCFHKIANFYHFKRKVEMVDRYLKSTIKPDKESAYSDILHKAVNEADIESSVEETSCENLENLNYNIIIDDKTEIVDANNCDNTRSDNKTEEACDDNQIVNYEYSNLMPCDEENFKFDECTDVKISVQKKKARKRKEISTVEPQEIIVGNQIELSTSSIVEIQKENIKIIEVAHLDKLPDFTNATVVPQIFTDGPPPLVPLVNAKTVNTSEIAASASLTKLPEDTPPLIPIKPLTQLDPATIVNTFAETVDEDLGLKLTCNLCEEEFPSVVALKEHRLTNCQTAKLQCNICKKEFKERKKLIGHLKGHMVVKNYRCKMCGKCYPNPSTFRIHMRSHTGERPFKCHICNKGFVRWAGVVGHMKTHTAHKPYKCETCGKGFKIASNLERHKVLHSGILPYCCNYCGKTFSQSDNLQLHIRTYHTHEKPYLCNVCGKGFVSSTRLQRHMWVHSGHKPYTCKQCPKAYSNSNDLKNHERTHSGDVDEANKPHACHICQMRFFHPCRLAKHMKTHLNKYPCGDCNKNFSSLEMYTKHMANKHDIHLSDAVKDNKAQVTFSFD